MRLILEADLVVRAVAPRLPILLKTQRVRSICVYLGNKSLAALRTFLAHRSLEGETVLLKALNCLQGARYIELAEARLQNQSFVYGWLRERVAI